MTGAKLVTSKKKEKAKKTLHPEGPSSRSRRGTGDIPSSSRDVPRGHNYVKVKIVVYQIQPNFISTFQAPRHLATKSPRKNLATKSGRRNPVRGSRGGGSGGGGMPPIRKPKRRRKNGFFQFLQPSFIQIIYYEQFIIFRCIGTLGDKKASKDCATAHSTSSILSFGMIYHLFVSFTYS